MHYSTFSTSVTGIVLLKIQMYEKKVQMQGLVFWLEKMLSYDEVFHVIHVAYGTSSECRGEIAGDIVKCKRGSCFFGGGFKNDRIKE